MPGEFKPSFWAFDVSAVDPYWQGFFWQDCIACVPCWEPSPVTGTATNPQILRGKRGDLPARTAGGSGYAWVANQNGVAVKNTGSLPNIPAVNGVDLAGTTRLTILKVRRKTSTAVSSGNAIGCLNSGNVGASTAVIYCPFSDGNAYGEYGGFGSAPNGISFAYTATTNIEVWGYTAGTRGSALYLNGVKKASNATAITRTATADPLTLTGNQAVGAGDSEELLFAAFLDAEWTDADHLLFAADPYAPIRLALVGGVIVPTSEIDANVNLTGVAASGAVGAFSVRADAAVSLSGVAAAGAVGTLSIAGSATIPLSGVAGSGSVGSFLATTGVTLTGVSGTGVVGSLAPSADATVALSGVAATGAVGSFQRSTSLVLSGVAGDGVVHSFVPVIIPPAFDQFSLMRDSDVNSAGAMSDAGLASLGAMADDLDFASLMRSTPVAAFGLMRGTPVAARGAMP